MDQSKGEDFALRKLSMDYAINMAISQNGDPIGAVEDARDIYMFLTQQDPVIDLPGDDEADEDNVVSFRDFLRNTGRGVTLQEEPKDGA